MGVFVEPPATGPGIFPNPPKDSGRSSNAAAGPRHGVLGAFEAAWDAQVLTDSSRGLEYGFQQVQEEQRAQVRAAGLEAPPSFAERGIATQHGVKPPYFDIARYYTDGPMQAEPYAMEMTSEYDKQINALNKAHPELKLKSSLAMWQETQRRAQVASRNFERSTLTGAGAGVASISGSMAGSFSPETDPLNVMTLGWGGLVGGVAKRLATTGVATGAAEALNELTGVQERRRLLGLQDYGFGRAVRSVGFAAAGGVALQGVGEAARIGANKWFRSAPNDPAPPLPEMQGPSEAPTHGPGGRVYPRVDTEQLILPMELPQVYGPSRLARLRETQDAAHVRNQIDDWEGPNPIDVKPYKETPADFYGPPLTQEEYARSIDPEAFRQWDKHSAEQDILQPSLHAADVSRAAVSERAAAARTIEDQASAIEERIAGTKSKKQVAKLTRELEELRLQRQTLLPDVSMPGVPDALRARVMRNDEKLRELSPLISRAYAAARDEWPDVMAAAQAREVARYPAAETRQLRMGSLMRRTLTEEEALGPRGELPTRPVPAGQPPLGALTPAGSPAPLTRQPMVDTQFPGVAQNPDIVAKLPADADVVDKVAAVRVQEAEVQSDALDRFTQKLAQILEPPKTVAPVILGAENLIQINGRTVNLDGVLIDEGGRQVTIRQYLADVQDDQEFIKSVGTCSIG